MPPVGTVRSIMNGRTGMPRWLASSTSRRTGPDSFEAGENTSTMTRAPSMPATMPSAYSTPVGMLRGAIQQRMPAVSRCAHTCSAAVESFDE